MLVESGVWLKSTRPEEVVALRGQPPVEVLRSPFMLTGQPAMRGSAPEAAPLTKRPQPGTLKGSFAVPVPVLADPEAKVAFYAQVLSLQSAPLRVEADMEMLTRVDPAGHRSRIAAKDGLSPLTASGLACSSQAPMTDEKRRTLFNLDRHHRSESVVAAAAGGSEGGVAVVATPHTRGRHRTFSPPPHFTRPGASREKTRVVGFEAGAGIQVLGAHKGSGPSSCSPGVLLEGTASNLVSTAQGARNDMAVFGLDARSLLGAGDTSHTSRVHTNESPKRNPPLLRGDYRYGSAVQFRYRHPTQQPISSSRTGNAACSSTAATQHQQPHQHRQPLVDPRLAGPLLALYQDEAFDRECIAEIAVREYRLLCEEAASECALRCAAVRHRERLLVAEDETDGRALITLKFASSFADVTAAMRALEAALWPLVLLATKETSQRELVHFVEQRYRADIGRAMLLDRAAMEQAHDRLRGIRLRDQASTCATLARRLHGHCHAEAQAALKTRAASAARAAVRGEDYEDDSEEEMPTRIGMIGAHPWGGGGGGGVAGDGDATVLDIEMLDDDDGPGPNVLHQSHSPRVSPPPPPFLSTVGIIGAMPMVAPPPTALSAVLHTYARHFTIPRRFSTALHTSPARGPAGGLQALAAAAEDPMLSPLRASTTRLSVEGGGTRVGGGGSLSRRGIQGGGAGLLARDRFARNASLSRGGGFGETMRAAAEGEEWGEQALPAPTLSLRALAETDDEHL